jgi:hypothetical protein
MKKIILSAFSVLILFTACEAERQQPLSEATNDTGISSEKEAEQSQTDATTEQELQKKADMTTALANEIYATGDHKRCRELKDDNQIASCEFNILANRAIKENDITVCDQASNAPTVTICKEAVEAPRPEMDIN